MHRTLGSECSSQNVSGRTSKSLLFWLVPVCLGGCLLPPAPRAGFQLPRPEVRHIPLSGWVGEEGELSGGWLLSYLRSMWPSLGGHRHRVQRFNCIWVVVFLHPYRTALMCGSDNE